MRREHSRARGRRVVPKRDTANLSWLGRRLKPRPWPRPRLRRCSGPPARWLPRPWHGRASKGVHNGLSTTDSLALPNWRGGAGGGNQRTIGVGADQRHAHAAGGKDAGEAGRAGGSRSCRCERRLQPEDVAASGKEAGETRRTGGSQRFEPRSLIGEGVPPQHRPEVSLENKKSRRSRRHHGR